MLAMRQVAWTAGGLEFLVFGTAVLQETGPKTVVVWVVPREQKAKACGRDLLECLSRISRARHAYPAL